MLCNILPNVNLKGFVFALELILKLSVSTKTFLGQLFTNSAPETVMLSCWMLVNDDSVEK